MARVLQNAFAIFFKKEFMIVTRHIKILIILLLVVGINFCCQTSIKKNDQTSDYEILNADIAFSDMSRQVGMKKAFLQYINNEGVLLRPDHLPLEGADAIDYISALRDTGYTLSWKPLKAEMAKSGELGYTYGIYELKLPDTVFRGTYVNIWKKQSDGEWKFVLNSSNPGLGE
jgi:ketosteroid isomerase-like protein